MRSSTLVLLFLIGVQAAANMRGGAQARVPPRRQSPTPAQELPDADLAPIFVPEPILMDESPDSAPATDSSFLEGFPDILPVPDPALLDGDSVPSVDPELFDAQRFRSPRVLFSDLPPEAEPGLRTRRHAGPPQNRGVYSVCDSVSGWVGNKTKATDISGNNVTVLPNVSINNVVKKQYFFETMCRGARSGHSGCLGVDSRHWNSYCTNTHTFVRALTSFQNLVAWRHIRINVACVCVLSRKTWRQ